jgi:integrase
MEPSWNLMSKPIPSLSPVALRNWRAGEAEKRDGAVSGLRVRRLKNGTHSWSLLINVNGVRKRVSVGEGLSLSQARLKASEQRSQISQGIDPSKKRSEQRRRALAVKAGVGTFESVIDAYFGGDGASLRSAKIQKEHLKRVYRHLLGYLAESLTITDLQLAVDKCASDSSARHAISYIRPICIWAVNRGYMSRDERFKDLKGPRRKTPIRQAHLSLAELDVFLKNISCDSYDIASIFMLLTGTRREEVISATWKEFNISEQLWIIPAERRKDTRTSSQKDKSPTLTHVVPLSDACCRLLSGVKRRQDLDLVFVGERNGVLRNWSRWSSRVERQIGIKVGPHIMRRSTSTILGDLGVSPHVNDAVLGHKNIGGRLLAGYNKSVYFNEVREALQKLGGLFISRIELLKTSTSDFLPKSLDLI